MAEGPDPLVRPIDDPESTTPEALLDRYAADLASVVEAVGADRVVAETDLGADDLETIEAGDVEDLDLRDAAAVLALPADTPDPETVLVEVRDHLLLSMSNAMLTVDRIAADVAGDLDPKEVQGMVEGRHPMTLGEYARLHHYVAAST